MIEIINNIDPKSIVIQYCAYQVFSFGLKGDERSEDNKGRVHVASSSPPFPLRLLFFRLVWVVLFFPILAVIFPIIHISLIVIFNSTFILPSAKLVRSLRKKGSILNKELFGLIHQPKGFIWMPCTYMHQNTSGRRSPQIVSPRNNCR